MRLRQERLDGDSRDGAGEYVVLGGGRLGASIARRLRAAGHAVTLVDERQDATDLPGVCGDPSDRRVLARAGLSERSTVVVATRRDRRNLLVAQLVRTRFAVREVLVLVNTPDRRDLVAETGHEPVCVTSVVSEAVTERLDGLSTDRERAG
ncbi:NAD-binding protein [Salinirubellus salinus]|uniref:NAD-binding protein n=1 Tax=Salinirubellus salinus TaxID=1364945 RepID=A0A9E7R3J2_9EURY|nr:NAD-binding protein [Salinirubellus salinus]UWM53995.1 NAD-binding protein [Salinirubellus salinus]